MAGDINSALDDLYKALGAEDLTSAADEGDAGEDAIADEAGAEGDDALDYEPAEADDNQEVGEVDGEPIAKSQGGDDDSDEDEEDDEEDEDEESDEDGDEPMDKSLTGDEEDDFSKSLAQNPALSQLADAVDQAFGGLQGALTKSMAQQEDVNKALAVGLTAALNVNKEQTDLIKSLTGKVDALANQLARVSGQPAAPRRAASSHNPPQVVEKSIGGGQPNGQANRYGLSKSLLGEAVKSAAELGRIGVGEAQVFDRTGTVPPAVFAKIKDLVQA